jgi:hypothetical protein
MGWSKVFLAGVFAFYATLASAAGDLAPDQARKARSEIWSQYKLVLPFLSQVLEDVPIKHASSEYLTSYGSSLGIYYRDQIFLSSTIFDRDGLLLDPTSLAVISHEAWHAYVDLILPRDRREALETLWVETYGAYPGVDREKAICFGDETAGTYFQNLVSVYSFGAARFAKERKLNRRFLELYENAYKGSEIRGYCGGEAVSGQAPRTITAKEVEFLRREAGNAFPKPEELIEALKRRFPLKPSVLKSS